MERAFARIAEELRAGDVVCIPEGKLTKDGTMERFRSGIERIIKESPVPVVPMALDGLWGSMFSRMPKAQKQLQKRGLRHSLTIGAPIPAEAVSAAVLEERVRALLP
jgi:1-acyl-sn-glycerol-3-phosphate acyltransferase